MKKVNLNIHLLKKTLNCMKCKMFKNVSKQPLKLLIIQETMFLFLVICKIHQKIQKCFIMENAEFQNILWEHCSIYQFLDKLEKPIISRHGLKGGRFIDSLYAWPQGLENFLGASIIKDTRIFTDHSLVISNIDLGIRKFVANKEHKEQIDFRRVMNIPMHIKKGEAHPSINTNVYKGEDFHLHSQLYDAIQKSVNDTSKHYMDRISEIQ